MNDGASKIAQSLDGRLIPGIALYCGCAGRPARCGGWEFQTVKTQRFTLAPSCALIAAMLFSKWWEGVYGQGYWAAKDVENFRVVALSTMLKATPTVSIGREAVGPRVVRDPVHGQKFLAREQGDHTETRVSAGKKSTGAFIARRPGFAGHTISLIRNRLSQWVTSWIRNCIYSTVTMWDGSSRFF